MARSRHAWNNGVNRMRPASLNLRCEQADKDTWRRVAGAQGVAEWANNVLNMAAEYEKLTGKPAFIYLFQAVRRARWHHQLKQSSTASGSE